MSDIKHIHNGIEITYDEKDNLWRFQLRGRERSAESLVKAKEFIDKPVVEKGEKTFVPIEAWCEHYSHGFKSCKVTSVAESSYGSCEYYWISTPAGRSKQAAYNIFPKNEKNDALVAKWTELDKQISDLHEKRNDVKSKMKYICE